MLFDFATYPIAKIKVFAPAAGLSLMIKAENYADTEASPIVAYATTTLEFEWEELVFDFPEGAATGVEYERLIMFPDFGSYAESDIWFFDDVVIDGVQNVNVESKGQQPSAALLTTNYPNPFNPQTTIQYDLPKASTIKLTVHDARGAYVKILVNEKQQSCDHHIVFDGSNLASGVYYCRLQAANQATTHKMILLK